MDGIPRGVEVLVTKASVDPEFRESLLQGRAEAAKEIDLHLQPAEAAMLNAIPDAQLEAIIDRVHVSPRRRAAFLGKAAVLMLAALSVTASGCDGDGLLGGSRGVRPDRPKKPGAQQTAHPDRQGE